MISYGVSNAAAGAERAIRAQLFQSPGSDLRRTLESLYSRLEPELESQFTIGFATCEGRDIGVIMIHPDGCVMAYIAPSFRKQGVARQLFRYTRAVSGRTLESLWAWYGVHWSSLLFWSNLGLRIQYDRLTDTNQSEIATMDGEVLETALAHAKAFPDERIAPDYHKILNPVQYARRLQRWRQHPESSLSV